MRAQICCVVSIDFSLPPLSARVPKSPSSADYAGTSVSRTGCMIWLQYLRVYRNERIRRAGCSCVQGMLAESAGPRHVSLRWTARFRRP